MTPRPPQLRTNTSGSISRGAPAEQAGGYAGQEQREDRQKCRNGSAIGHQLRTNVSSSIGHDSATAEQSGSCEVREQTADRRSHGSSSVISQAPDLQGSST